MSQYTTGEIAKLCGITVRTVQYYDTRGILMPCALTEGGRRLYTDEDVRRLKAICLLRELGLSINVIGQLLSEEDPGSVIDLLLSQHIQALRAEIAQRQSQIERLTGLRRALRGCDDLSIESIGDMAGTLDSKKNLNRMYMTFMLIGIPLGIADLALLIHWIMSGAWQPFAVLNLLEIIPAILLSRYYLRRVAYVCPKCGRTFRPSAREAFFARHTLRTRKLTCPACGHKGFCVEVWNVEPAAPKGE